VDLSVAKAGSVTIENNGAMTTGNAEVDGTVALSGGASWNVGNLQIGKAAGPASVTVQGSTLRLDPSLSDDLDPIVAPGFFAFTVGAGAQGALNVSNGGAVILEGASLEFGGIGGGTGVVDIGAGGSLQLTRDAGKIGGVGVGSGQLTVEKGGSLTAGYLDVGSNGSASVNGTAALSAALEIASGGSAIVAGGGDVTSAGYVTVAKGGTLNVRAGSVEIGQVTSGQTGVVSVGKGGTLIGGGTIQGKILTLGGKVSIGDPQSLTVEGDYQQVSGVLDFQLAGPHDYDQFIVKGGGVDIVGGIVELDFIDGFAPSAGDDFQLISADEGITFDPGSIELNGLAPGFQWRFSYDPNVGAYDLVALNDASLGNPTAAPEPATWAMMLVGLGGLSMLRATRRKIA
jgi:hypothetical protein